jgi:hypothetical protein
MVSTDARLEEPSMASVKLHLKSQLNNEGFLHSSCLGQSSKLVRTMSSFASILVVLQCATSHRVCRRECEY